MTLQEAKIWADDYALEKLMNYTEQVGSFYMQDPAEQQAADEVYKQAYQDKLQELLQKVSSNENN